MRYYLLLLLLFPCSLFGQKLLGDGTNSVRIIQNDKIIQAEIMPVDDAPSLKNNLYYSWYAANEIHISQGGFSGKLLNGFYAEYYKDKNLKEQGTFKEGLKNGNWKTWNDDGSLLTIETWKNGILIPPDPRTLLQKLNIFKKKKKQASKIDTTKFDTIKTKKK